MYTLLYLKWITNRTPCIVHGTLLSVVWQPGWEGDLGETEYMWTYTAQSLCCPPETTTTLLISYTPIQN